MSRTVTILVPHGYGQLGNRLITFSNLVALAMEHGARVRHLDFAPYCKYFAGFQKSEIPGWPTPGWGETALLRVLGPKVKRGLGMGFATSHGFRVDAPEEHEMREHEVRSLLVERRPPFLLWTAWNLHFNSLLQKHAPALREVFRPLPDAHGRAQTVLSTVPNEVVRVGVHIRRRDYAGHQGGRYFYDDARYAAAMDCAIAAFPGRRVHFFVASDEPLSGAILSRGDVSSCPGDLSGDLCALGGCSIVLGPPSTFSDWAAFMGDAGRVTLWPESMPTVEEWHIALAGWTPRERTI